MTNGGVFSVEVIIDETASLQSVWQFHQDNSRTHWQEETAFFCLNGEVIECIMGPDDAGFFGIVEILYDKVVLGNLLHVLVSEKYLTLGVYLYFQTDQLKLPSLYPFPQQPPIFQL